MFWLTAKIFFQEHLPKFAIGAVIFFALAAMVGGGVYVRGLAARAENAEAAAEIAKAEERKARKAMEGMSVEIEGNRKALEARDEQINKLARGREATAAKDKEAYDADPKARAWADCALPDAVACLFK
jgi:hypothetical protein